LPTVEGLPGPSNAPQASALPIPARGEVVLRNDYAHFQFYTGNDTAFFTLWHRVSDPIHSCETTIARTYLSPIVAYPVENSHYRFWKNMEPFPHPIEWRVHRHSCDGCYYQIDYRRTDTHHVNDWNEGWRFYGLLQASFPQ
jgi:hypothetical protein